MSDVAFAVNVSTAVPFLLIVNVALPIVGLFDKSLYDPLVATAFNVALLIAILPFSSTTTALPESVDAVEPDFAAPICLSCFADNESLNPLIFDCAIAALLLMSAFTIVPSVISELATALLVAKLPSVVPLVNVIVPSPGALTAVTTLPEPLTTTLSSEANMFCLPAI